VGPDVWREDWLALPGEVGQVWRDQFTGTELKAELLDGRPRLLLRDVFGTFPVAALYAD
jgi:hypothetical protein